MATPAELAFEAIFGPILNPVRKFKRGTVDPAAEMASASLQRGARTAGAAAQIPFELGEFLFSEFGEGPVPGEALRQLAREPFSVGGTPEVPATTGEVFDAPPSNLSRLAPPPSEGPATGFSSRFEETLRGILPTPSTGAVGDSEAGRIAAAQDSPLLGLEPEVIDQLGLSEGARFLREGPSPISGPATEFGAAGVDFFSEEDMDFVRGGGSVNRDGRRLTVTDTGELTTIPSSAFTPPGALTVENPFADPSLSPEQARRIAEQQAEIQRVAVRERRKADAAAFRAKARKARRILTSGDPLITEQAKQQIINQLQTEMVELSEDDPLDLYRQYEAENSPEVKFVQFKSAMRDTLNARYGEGEGDRVAELYSMDAEGNIDDSKVKPILEGLEDQKRTELALGQEFRRIQFQDMQDRQKSISSIREQAERVWKEDLQDSPEAIQSIIQRAAAHQRRFGQLPGPVPEGELTLGKIYDWITGTNISGQNPGGVGGAKPRPTVVNAGGGLGSQQIQIRETITNATQADVQRAEEEVARMKSQGQTNVGIRIIFADGSEGIVQ